MRQWRPGVRGRATIVATAVVGTALAVTAALLVVATRSALYRSVETTTAARAVDVAAQVSAGNGVTTVPLLRGIAVQVIQDGVVLASTADIEGQRPIIDVAASPGAVISVETPTLDAAEQVDEAAPDDGDEGPFLVAVASTRVGGRPGAVYAAAPLSAVRDATRTLVPLVVLGVPVITALVAIVVAGLTRRALRPVDAMTRQANSISYSDLHLRIPEPTPDDEVRRLAVVLNRMLDRLDTAASRRRQFISDAGHELKSPVATLVTMAEVAEAAPEGLTVQQFATDVAGQSRRLATLVEDLLTLAQSDEKGLPIRLEPVDLGEVLVREVRTVRAGDVIVDISGVRPVTARCDRDRIGQVARNLVDNAVQHADSMIRVECDLVGGAPTFRVGDDGPGIDPADRERVFDRFVRLDESRSRRSGGTGLGMSVVRRIVEAHGGTVEVGEDEVLGGASITVTLPPEM